MQHANMSARARRLRTLAMAALLLPAMLVGVGAQAAPAAAQFKVTLQPVTLLYTTAPSI